MDERVWEPKADDRVSGAPDTWPLSAAEAARALGVSERTIRRAITRGVLPATKIAGVYRIAPGDLARYRDHSAASHVTPFPPRQEPSGNLPHPRTALVGRSRERETARALLLAESVPLLTLTGPGGVGKTRLALAIAHEVAGSFADSVVFVDLAPLPDPSLVLPTIAAALGVHESGDRPFAAALAAFLKPRQLLLILDNFEHLLAAAPAVAELLGSCPALQILATSRAPLHLREEHLLSVPPLALPDAMSGTSLTALGSFEAIALFVQRARAADARFSLTAANAGTVAEVCARLDGLPLAIELAAARLRSLSVAALLALLTARLRLLTGGERDRPERQRTMRNAIAWSYDLLGPEERALFRRLAVFAGGFDAEAAEAIAGAGTPPIVDRISALADHSLVCRIDGSAGSARWTMLETIREFGRERLAESDEEEPAGKAHASYFLAYATTSASRLRLPGQETWMSRLAEHDNLRVALAWLDRAGDGDAMLRLAGALAELWFVHGYFAEGRDWLERALALGGEVPEPLQATALGGAGALSNALSDHGRAEAFIARSLALWRKLGEQEPAARDLIRLGLALTCQGRYAEAAVRLEEALALCEPLVGSSDSAARLASLALNELGGLAYVRGDYARAEKYLLEAMRRQRTLAIAWALADTLRHLGDLALMRGNAGEAAVRYREGLEHGQSQGDPWLIARILAGSADVALAWDRPERAARLLATVVAVDDVIGGPVFTCDHERQARTRAAVHAALGEAAFAAAWSAGRILPMDKAVTEAIAMAGAGPASASKPASPVPSSQPAIDPLFRLSARERDVLACLVRRDTAREIAEQFGISERTVEHQIESIYNKLGVSSRREAAAVALRSGLA